MTRAPDLATAKSPRNFAQGQNEDGSERHAGERRKAKRALADHGPQTTLSNGRSPSVNTGM